MIHDTIQDIIILMDSLKYTIYHDKGNRSGRDCMLTFNEGQTLLASENQTPLKT